MGQPCPRRGPSPAVTDGLRLIQQGYAHAAEGWATGAERAYLPMAAALLAASPVPLGGKRLLDVGAGTGAVARLAVAAGARPVAFDASLAMLAHDAPHRPPAAVADILHLPVRRSSAHGAAAAFVLNHLTHPVAALRELARVVEPGGFVLASVFSTADRPAAKAAIDGALATAGWEPPDWYRYVKAVDGQLGSVTAMRAAAEEAGLVDPVVTDEPIDTGTHEPAAIVEFRLSQPHVAPFLRAQSADVRARVTAECVEAVAATGQGLAPGVVILAASVAGSPRA